MTNVNTSAGATLKLQKMYSIRITPESKLVLDQILSDANNKDLGCKVKPENVVAIALTLVTQCEVDKLKEAALINADKLELRYRQHVKNNGHISKDDFLGEILRGRIGQD